MMDRTLVVCIAGMAGSGKSTVARRLAKKYGLRYFSGGDALRALAVEEGFAGSQRGWWESKEGLTFLEKRKENPRFDQAVDTRLKEAAKQGNVIFDSWVMPWLLHEGFKIWLEASPRRRAERVAKRDGTSVKKALESLREKEEKSKAIYKRIYGFNLGKSFDPFDLVLDTDNLSEDEVFQVLCMVLENVALRQN